MTATLRLHHELLLLALHDTKGTSVATGWLQDGLAGALFCELILGDRVGLEPGGRWRGDLVTPRSRAPFGDEVLDDALRRITDAKRRANAQNTVIRLKSVPKLRARTAVALCRMGILRETEGRVLWLFRRRLFPTVDPGPERALVERIRRAIEEPSADVTERTAILVSLAELTGVLRTIYTGKELRAHKARLKELRTLGGTGTEATRKAIEAAQAAIAATVAVSAAASAAST